MTKDTHNAESNRPEIALCAHATLRRAMRSVSQIYNAAMKPAGLKATQFTLLAVVTGRGPIAMTGLAETLVMDRTTLTRNLKPLEAKGWVQTERDRDGRVRLISITDAGKSVVAEATPYWRNAQARIRSALGPDRLSGLLDGLQTLTNETRG